MVTVDRVQTGLRIERNTLKVLKGLAEYLDLSLGDLLEGVLLHTFEGKTPFSRETQQKIADLKKVYGLELTAKDSHRLAERGPREASGEAEAKGRRGRADAPAVRRGAIE